MKIGTGTVLLAVMLVLTGCASEVDKCVDAYMKSWSEKQSRIRGGEKIISEYGGGIEVLDTRSPTEMEARFRFVCLQASGRGTQ